MKNVWRLLAAVLFLQGCRSGDTPATVAIVSPHLQYEPTEFRNACTAYAKTLQVDMYGVSEGKLPVFSVRELSRHSLVLLEGMGARISLLRPQIDSLKALTKVLFLDSSLIAGNLSLRQYPELGVYWANGNTDNYKSMLSYIAKRIFDRSVTVIPPVVYPDYGFYYPGRDFLFRDARGYLRWYDSAHRGIAAAGIHDDTARPSVGLVFYQTNFVKKDLRHIDSLIRSVERHGARPITLLGKGSFNLDSFFRVDGRPVVDVVIYGGLFLNFSKPEKGRAEAATLDVPLLGAANQYLEDRRQWENDPGGFAPNMSDHAFFTERDGVFEAMNIAAAETDSLGNGFTAPIAYQINWRVERALAWARLRRMANRDKKIVCTYYSEGSGKANVGADIDAYLDVPASLSRLLQAWRNAGYATGDGSLPSSAALARQMSQHASNVGSWAPAELKRRAAAGDVVVIPEEEYLGWFHTYPAEQQEEVLAHWGPAPGKLMTVMDSNGKRSIVIPVIRRGNIILAPHPNWGLQDNTALIYGKTAIPPSHAYIAFFEWMKRNYQPDAWLSLFSQLSLMPGKQEGPSAHDWVGELVGNIPHISLTPLIANGGVADKRRTNALTIGYLTTVTTAGLSDSLRMVDREIAEWQAATNAALKGRLQRDILAACRNLRLDADVIDTLPDFIPRVADYLRRLARQRMPLGSHILGEAPKGKDLITMVGGMVGDSGAGKMLRQQDLALDYRNRLMQTPNEITQVIRALDGKYIVPGLAGDPMNDPDALPGGRDLYSGNDKAMPSKTAWELGRRLADQLLVQYERKHGHGAYPKKVAFVLWSSEITHTQGIMEAEILALIGVKPVWNSKGQVMDVSLIPAPELGRPRIDVLVTTSGTYRDHFGDKIRLLDKAVRLAAAAPGGDSAASTGKVTTGAITGNGYPNWVARHTDSYRRQLRLDSGAAAALRIFSSAPGAYSTNLEFAAENGESWKKDTTLSSLYLNRMANGYGQASGATYQRELFELNIKDIDAAAFSRSSSVYGMMDHPMVAAYFGAYDLVVRNTTGRTPDLFIDDLQDADIPEVMTAADAYHLELRSRYLNPAWIKGMMSHGYDGARYMEAFTEDLFLWNVTSPDMVRKTDWDAVYATYVEDRGRLGLSAYLAKQNPYAQQSMLSVMLEAAEKGYWRASDAQLEKMAQLLAASVSQNGPTCNTAVCNSPNLSSYVTAVMQKIPGSENAIRDYQRRLQAVKTTGVVSGQAAAAAGEAGQSSAGTARQPVTGQKMTTETVEQAARASSRARPVVWMFGLSLLGVLFALGWRRGK